MSEETNHPTPEPQESPKSTPSPIDRTLVIRMWPKTPVLYPMAIVALVCCLVAHFAGSSQLSDYPFGSEPAKAETSSESGNPPANEGETDATTPAPEGAQILHADPILPAQAGGDTANAASADEAKELDKKRVDRTLAVIFLFVLLFSLFSICVDLDVRWAIIYFSGIVIFALIVWILQITTNFLPQVFDVLDKITPMANSQFYLGVFLVWVVLMIMSFIVTRFHYVKIEANEVVVVGGMLERQQRYDTMRMRYTKEIHDVMEYYLPFVRSGRLIFSFPEQSEAVIIDNVINIKKVARRLDGVVGAATLHEHRH